MKKVSLLVFLFCFFAIVISAQSFDDLISQVDNLHSQDAQQEALSLLQQMLSGDLDSSQRAEVLWRMSRAQLSYADQRENAGADTDELLSMFDQGKQYAIEAIEQNPVSVPALYWQASNIGRWGQTKGILDSLALADDMRDLLAQAIELDPNHADSYYVLSQLYLALPGLISFGDKDYSVSLARKAVELMEQEISSGARTGSYNRINFSFYIKLAEALHERDWSQRKRNSRLTDKREEFAEATNALERAWYFEGQTTIPDMSDEDEADMILADVIEQLEAIPAPGVFDTRDLEDARLLAADWD